MAHEANFDNASRFNEMSVFLDLVLSFYFSVNHDTKFLLRVTQNTVCDKK